MRATRPGPFLDLLSTKAKDSIMTQRRTRKAAADDQAAEQQTDTTPADSDQQAGDGAADDQPDGEAAADDQAAEQSDGDRVEVRILTGVSGTDFSWKRGDTVSMASAEAEMWADGIRAELAD